jgi:hypothetical protein
VAGLNCFPVPWDLHSCRIECVACKHAHELTGMFTANWVGSSPGITKPNVGFGEARRRTTGSGVNSRTEL